MTVYRYASTGDPTTPDGSSWAEAYTTFAGALAAATTPGDEVWVDMANIAAGDAEVAGTTTWTILTGVTVRIGTQSGASDLTSGDMGSTYWFGNSTTGRTINLNAAGTARIVGGLTLRTNGNAAITVNGAAVGSLSASKVTLWNSHPTGGTFVAVGQVETYTDIDELVITIDDTTPPTTQYFRINGYIDINKLTATYGGTATSGFFGASVNSGVVTLRVHGGDISGLGSGASICNNFNTTVADIYLENVVLPASFVAMDSQTNLSKAGANLTLRDCSSSGTVVPFLHANSCGELRMESTNKLTAGIAGVSWKIVTTANCSGANPYYSPWMYEYKAAATVEPTLEVARYDSATAFTDAQFWLETLAKKTSSSVQRTLLSTRGTGTDIPAGVGTGSWGGTALWSGELTQGSQVLAEDGYLQSRICAAVDSKTIYVDPGAAA